jgi:predicted ABC-type ATPase
MLMRLKELAAQRVSFAFETTLASRTFAPWVKGLVEQGFQFILVYLWVPEPSLSVARVAQRVATGGHHVPDDVVRRRYERGLRNFFELYRPLADFWYIYDSSAPDVPCLIAEGTRAEEKVADPQTWQRIKEQL